MWKILLYCFNELPVQDPIHKIVCACANEKMEEDIQKCSIYAVSSISIFSASKLSVIFRTVSMIWIGGEGPCRLMCLKTQSPTGGTVFGVPGPSEVWDLAGRHRMPEVSLESIPCRHTIPLSWWLCPLKPWAKINILPLVVSVKCFIRARRKIVNAGIFSRAFHGLWLPCFRWCTKFFALGRRQCKGEEYANIKTSYGAEFIFSFLLTFPIPSWSE